MNWESIGLDYRLVAEDGEILESVRYTYQASEWQVQSTGKRYASSEQAKKAAELIRCQAVTRCGL
jgi:hypothetical protein